MLLQDKEKNQLMTISLVIIAVVAVAFALYFTRPIMIPFVLALFVRLLRFLSFYFKKHFFDSHC